jgi:hypothetical protein
MIMRKTRLAGVTWGAALPPQTTLASLAHPAGIAEDDPDCLGTSCPQNSNQVLLDERHANDAGDAVGVRGEPGVEYRAQVRGRSVNDGGIAARRSAALLGAGAALAGVARGAVLSPQTPRYDEVRLAVIAAARPAVAGHDDDRPPPARLRSRRVRRERSALACGPTVGRRVRNQ